MDLNCGNSLLLPVKPNSKNLNLPDHLWHIFQSELFSCEKAWLPWADQALWKKQSCAVDLLWFSNSCTTVWFPLNSLFWNVLETHFSVSVTTQQ